MSPEGFGRRVSERVPAAVVNRTEPLPMTPEEVQRRGWDQVDVVFVTGDAYVDHPSFAMAVLGRVLEAAGLRVAVLAQPDWRSAEPWRALGRPRLFYAISAGNMDSMINHYTANRKVRNDDAYSPGGRIKMRPDRATLAYTQRSRQAFRDVPVIVGGVEASMRRLAHYDYWSDKVRRSILLDAKADLLVYGMGEEAIVEIARRLQAGETVRNLRHIRQVVYSLGASEAPPDDEVVTLPSYQEVSTDPYAFAEATRLIHRETNPYNARRLVQYHDRQAVVQNPPGLPLSRERLDEIYELPYTRKPHPSYRESIPAWEVVKDSVTITRGCFGGCTFCSITAHQGRIVQSRSPRSVVGELRVLARDPDFKGTVSDLGGPTANTYEMGCRRPAIERVCRRLSCLHPKICPLLETGHGPLIELMKESRRVAGVKKVLVASGIRMDLARLSPEYVQELAAHHVGGRLKVAPEHTDPDVLRVMKKPGIEDFEWFAKAFQEASFRAGKNQQLTPYFMASHPGSDLEAMIDLALFLKRTGHRPDQVQDFIPAPMDIATAMHYTGLDPFTKEPVPVARHLGDRRLQRALMQFFEPENYFAVRQALIKADRRDLIGDGCEALIPSKPPPAAIAARRRRAQASLRRKRKRPDQRRAGTVGYRPGRRGAKQR